MVCGVGGMGVGVEGLPVSVGVPVVEVVVGGTRVTVLMVVVGWVRHLVYLIKNFVITQNLDRIWLIYRVV